MKHIIKKKRGMDVFIKVGYLCDVVTHCHTSYLFLDGTKMINLFPKLCSICSVIDLFRQELNNKLISRTKDS